MSERGSGGRGDRLDGVVRGNDWRSLEPADIGEGTPTGTVTVVLPCYMGQTELELTFAGLASQTYPSHLLEVVVVDDGSAPPIVLPAGAPFTATVVAQQRDGFGLARARNLGAARASGEILVFLDCDMIPEPQLVEAHARWHHVDDRLLTVGFRHHADFDGITAEEIGAAGGPAEAVIGREVTSPEWIEFHMTRTHNLTSADTDLFRVASGGNLGVRREFFHAVGGCDASFRQWGGEDLEFGFRAFNWGGVLVPEREAVAWHQGAGAAPDPAEKASQVEQRHKLSHLVAERTFRRSTPGRSFQVPFVTVAVNSSELTFDEAAEQVEGVLASAFHDLMVGLWVPERHPERVQLERQYGSDHRVLLSRDLLADVPHAAVRLEIPPRVRLSPTSIGSLLRGLEGFGLVRVDLEEFGEIRMARTRALRRAVHAGAEDPWSAAGELFGERTMSQDAARLTVVAEDRRGTFTDGKASATFLVLIVTTVRKMTAIRSPADLATVTRWGMRAMGELAGRERLARRQRGRERKASKKAGRSTLFVPGWEQIVPGWVQIIGDPDHLPGADLWSGRQEGVEVVVVAPDAPDEVSTGGVPVVRVGPLSGIPLAPPVDHRRFNPAGFRPVGGGARIEAAPDLPTPEERIEAARATLAVRIDRIDGLASAQRLVEFTAAGVPVLLDEVSGSEAWLGSRLAAEVTTVDADCLADPTERERASVAQRRAALAHHTLPARLRQVRSAAGLPLLSEPSVSVVVATNRPAMVERIIAIVAAQDHPNTELVLAFHGDGFGNTDPTAPDGLEVTALRFPAETIFGDALSKASSVASGEWIAKMDDDDWYGSEHLTDLLLAASYSGADLVGKGAEFVYLEDTGLTIRRDLGNNEVASPTLSGGTLLVRAQMLREVNGWRGVRRGVDRALIDDVTGVGGQIWRTHPFGYLLRRTGGEHTWKVNERYFLRHAGQHWDGPAFGVADVESSGLTGE